MTFLEVTVGTEKQILNVDHIERIVSSEHGSSIAVRKGSGGRISFIHVSEDTQEIVDRLGTVGATILRIQD